MFFDFFYNRFERKHLALLQNHDSVCRPSIVFNRHKVKNCYKVLLRVLERIDEIQAAGATKMALNLSERICNPRQRVLQNVF